MHSAKKCLENGHTMIIFPEGARSRDGSLLPFKSGAAKLAIDTNKKIIPVRIDGSFEIFSRWIKRPRLFDWKHFRKYKLRIKFGTVIDPEGMTVDELTTKLKQEIVEMKCKRKDE